MIAFILVFDGSLTRRFMTPLEYNMRRKQADKVRLFTEVDTDCILGAGLKESFDLEQLTMEILDIYANKR